MSGDTAMTWTDQDGPEKDYYVAFRGAFELASSSEVEIRLLGATTFLAWLDGGWLAEGPARFPAVLPEYLSVRARPRPGRHVLAVEAHYAGLQTNVHPDIPPFLWCQVLVGDRRIPIEWKCLRLEGHHSQTRRVSQWVGWILWRDTRKEPADWQAADFDDTAWPATSKADPGIGPIGPPTIAPVRRIGHKLSPLAEGEFAETFKAFREDPPAGFFLRDLGPTDLPPQGLWRRYDLGRVCLGRPRFLLDLPAGAVVDMGYAEYLQHGRVAPYIYGLSCNFDRFIARGGLQEFCPHNPRGMRFLEVHVLAEGRLIRFVEEAFDERGYHDQPVGRFACDDDMLNRIWRAGVDTYRACAEDAILDCPTRERGQWLGDATVGMATASVAYADVALTRRCLVHSAICARRDGLITGISPCNPCFIPSYSMRWAAICLEYYRLSGDRRLLEELYPYAWRNLAALEPRIGDEGLGNLTEWNFVDWGCLRPEGTVDILANLFLLECLGAMDSWCRILDRRDDLPRLDKLYNHIRGVAGTWLEDRLKGGGDRWRSVGYHAAALALRAGLIDGRFEAQCVEYLKAHMLECFPNDLSAPRNSDGSVRSSRIITPYFAHFVLPLLIERGQMDFVMDQYRTCWGWAIGEGRTTLVEVFDTRWSHCHQWSSCPTWQLSRYVLGLHNRFDLGRDHYDLRLIGGSLRRAEGAIPFTRPFGCDGDDPSTGAIDVSWRREGGKILYHLRTPRPVWLHPPATQAGGKGQVVEVAGQWQTVLP